MGYRKLGVKSAHRRAMLRNATTSLLKNGQIDTTEPRAKEIVSVTEKMITLAKKGDLASRRRVLAYLTEEDVATNEIAEKYADRQGGYTRIIRLDQRRGDAAQMARIQMV